MKPVPLSKWDESLEHVIDDMKGHPLNVHSLMANHPKLLNAWWDFRNYAVRGGALGQRDCELVILRVAVHMRSWYEWASHVDRGLAAGLSIEEIERVRQAPDSPEWDERDSSLLTAIDDLLTERAIHSDTLARLSQHFSDHQIMDVVAIHGIYITLGCMTNTWGLALDGPVLDRLPDGVSRSEFERSIGSAK